MSKNYRFAIGNNGRILLADDMGLGSRKKV